MSDQIVARENMVAGQIRTNKVTDHRIVDALRAVPRERFVPEGRAGVAYVDEDVEIAPGRFMMEPLVLARLLQAGDVGPDDVVLDVGCGNGYSSVVLSHLAAAVVSLEEDGNLAERAGELVAELQADKAVVVTGNLAEGHAEQAPYDVIFLNGSVDQIPDDLSRQLADGGRLVAVVNEGPVGTATLFQQSDGVLLGTPLFEASTSPLPGFEMERGFVFQ